MKPLKARIQTDYDDRGVKEAEDDLEGLGKAARQAGEEGQGALSGLGESLAGASPLAVAGAAAAAGAALVGFVADTLDTASNLQDLSDRSGLSAESLQVLGRVAQQSGGDIEDVADAGREMQLRLAEAALDGAGPAATALGHLGLSIADLQGLDAAATFELLRDRLSEVEDPAHRLFLQEELLGGSTERLNGLLSLSADAYAEHADAIRQAGILTDEQTAKADQAADALAEATAALQAQAQAIIAELAPAVTLAADGIGALLGVETEQTRQTYELIGAEHTLARQWAEGSITLEDYRAGIERLRTDTEDYIPVVSEQQRAEARATVAAQRRAATLSVVGAAHRSATADALAYVDALHAEADALDRLSAVRARASAFNTGRIVDEFGADVLPDVDPLQFGRRTIGGQIASEGPALDADRQTVQRPEDTEAFF